MLGICSKLHVDNSEFQLITLSRDKTLQFWPVDTDVIMVRGYSTCCLSIKHCIDCMFAESWYDTHKNNNDTVGPTRLEGIVQQSTSWQRPPSHIVRPSCLPWHPRGSTSAPLAPPNTIREARVFGTQKVL